MTSAKATTGDWIKDFYLDYNKITDEEEKSKSIPMSYQITLYLFLLNLYREIVMLLGYVDAGKEAVEHMWGEIPLEGWVYQKKVKECMLYHKKAGSTMSCFRVDTEFDWPVDVVVEYCKEPEKRMLFDDGYDWMKF